MSKIIVRGKLPFVSVILIAGSKRLEINNVLLDTGSYGSIFKTEDLEKIDIRPQGNDRLVEVPGIGGSEYVIQVQITQLQVDDLVLSPAVIQLGEVNYGFGINGILGFDFFRRTGALIDFKNLELRKG